MKRNLTRTGYSLVEILIVIFIFTILTVIITQSLAVSLRSSRKSDNISEVRTNLEHAVAVMERNLRSAKVTCSGSFLDDTVNYEDQYGNSVSFSCNDSNPSDTFIASSSGRLTNQNVDILTANCLIFSCEFGGGGVPPSVDIDITARDRNNLGAEGATINVRTKILTRDY